MGLSEEASLRMHRSYRVALIAAVVSSGISFASSSFAEDLPPGDGHDIVQSACTSCHGIELIVSQRHTADEWRDVVSQMVGNGASLTDDQFATVVKYLSTTLAPESPAPAPATQAAPPTTTAH